MGRKTIQQYLDGELSPRAAERVEQHVTGCSRCAEVLTSLRIVDAALRRETPAAKQAPDIASRVTAELHHRGAFLKARVAAGKRRLLGANPLLAGTAGVLAVAALVLVAVGLAVSHITQERWAGEAGPVLKDTELVLVRLVHIDASERVAVARDESKRLSLSERLADVVGRAEPAWAGDLAPLEETFKLLAEGRPLPPDVVAKLNDGELLDRTVRLRQSLHQGG
jgi:anti-sigma factor RsiW